MPSDSANARHRAVSHRGPSRFEQRRDRACDRLADTIDALPTRRTLLAGAVGGVLATGAAVGAQAVVGTSADDAAASSATTAIDASDSRALQEAVAEQAAVSRGQERVPLQPEVTDPQALAKARAADARALELRAQRAQDAAEAREKAAEARRKKAELASRDPKDIARTLLGTFGWGDDQFSCLDAVWTQESGWRVDAANPSSGAFGIPQALPGSKMASAGSDWQTNPATQIKWGLGYIKDRYGSPCGAQSFKAGHGWY